MEKRERLRYEFDKLDIQLRYAYFRAIASKGTKREGYWRKAACTFAQQSDTILLELLTI